MTVGSLFSGAGLMDWGLTLAGFEHRWFCESDPYCRGILERRWPGVPVYDDVRELERPERVDILAGGFPCQPFSAAGKQLGKADERWLWPEFARLVGELRPRYVLVENVPGLLAGHGGMGNVLGDLASLGYGAEWGCLSAAGAGAPHLRERVFVVAYPEGEPVRAGLREGEQAEQWRGRPSDSGSAAGDTLADTECERREGRPRLIGRVDPDRKTPVRGEGSSQPTRRGETRGVGDVQDADRGTVQPRRLRWGAPQTGGAGWWAAEPDVGRVAHGVPSRLDRLAAIGNGVVPQVAQWVGERILECEAMSVSLTSRAPSGALPGARGSQEQTR